jgi:hypothetical protein
MRKLLLLAGLCAAVGVAIAGCGGSQRDPAAKPPNPYDTRAVAFACMQNDRLPVRLVGKDTIQVADPATGPRIKFFLNGGQAEAAQFAGQGEGAEQINNALLFVRNGSASLLQKLEGCLQSL